MNSYHCDVYKKSSIKIGQIHSNKAKCLLLSKKLNSLPLLTMVTSKKPKDFSSTCKRHNPYASLNMLFQEKILKRSWNSFHTFHCSRYQIKTRLFLFWIFIRNLCSKSFSARYCIAMTSFKYFRMFKGRFPLSRKSGNRPLKIRNSKWSVECNW